MSAIARFTIWSTAKTSSPDTAPRGIVPMYAPSSNVSARNSAMSTQVSTTSKTTLVLDTVGPQKGERRGIHWAWSISAKTAFLGVVFVLVPVFLYIEFRSAHETSQELLLRSVRAEGRTISQSLLPLLANADPSALPEIGRDLARYAGEVTTIKLLLQPAGTQNATEGFYYVASWPPVAPSNLEAQRDTLASQGVLGRASETCTDATPVLRLLPRA